MDEIEAWVRNFYGGDEAAVGDFARRFVDETVWKEWMRDDLLEINAVSNFRLFPNRPRRKSNLRSEERKIAWGCDARRFSHPLLPPQRQ